MKIDLESIHQKLRDEERIRITMNFHNINSENTYNQIKSRLVEITGIEDLELQSSELNYETIVHKLVIKLKNKDVRIAANVFCDKSYENFSEGWNEETVEISIDSFEVDNELLELADISISIHGVESRTDAGWLVRAINDDKDIECTVFNKKIREGVIVYKYLKDYDLNLAVFHPNPEIVVKIESIEISDWGRVRQIVNSVGDHLSLQHRELDDWTVRLEGGELPDTRNAILRLYSNEELDTHEILDEIERELDGIYYNDLMKVID